MEKEQQRLIRCILKYILTLGYDYDQGFKTDFKLSFSRDEVNEMKKIVEALKID